jgi:putative membrane protein
MTSDRSNRNVWLGLAILALVIFLAVPMLGGGMMARGFATSGVHPFLGTPWLWGLGLFGVLIRVAVWGAVIMLLVALFRRRSASFDSGFSRSERSYEILKRRYAAGEITREQFEEMRRVLEPTD